LNKFITMEFDLPKEQSSIIKVIGIGGGGGNAVNYMYERGITGVDFVLCNTDKQALELSSVPNKIQLGLELTEGLGAGANPEVGKECTKASLEEIKEILGHNTKMVFITAGMGGGTGTGGAPVIAEIAREMGILTVAIVTTPFSFEGRRRKDSADLGLEDLRKSVDTLIVINNDKVREIYGNLVFAEAFAKADDILSNAARGIAEIITVAGNINVDFQDVQTVMKDSGLAVMGTANAKGDNRARQAIETALNSPLLEDNNIQGANYILLNISYGAEEVLMDEISEIMDYVQDIAGRGTDILFGTCKNDDLGDELNVIIIATGFEGRNGTTLTTSSEKTVMQLEDTPPVVEGPVKEITQSRMEFQTPPVVEKPIDDVIFDKVEDKPTPSATPEESYAWEPKMTESQPSDNTAESTSEETEGFVRHELNSDIENTAEEASIEGEFVDDNFQIDRDRLQKQQDERVNKLKGLSKQLKSPSHYSDIENVPAYKRREVDLEDQPHSSENKFSRYTLSENEDEKPEIRSNNSFLHDNVD